MANIENGKWGGSTAFNQLASKIKELFALKTELPTAVSELTNDRNYQTDTEVSSAITTAISGVTQFDYQIVNELPTSGTKGVIYLVPNSGSGTNIYDEYIWIVQNEVGRFELFGEQQVTVVEYVGDGTYVEVVDGSGANAGKKVVQLTSAKQALLDSALQSVTSSGSTVTISGTGTTKNLEVSSTIVDGASAGATALQSVASSGATVVVTGDGTDKNLEVSQTIVNGAAKGATSVQTSDEITAAEIDALFA